MSPIDGSVLVFGEAGGGQVQSTLAATAGTSISGSTISNDPNDYSILLIVLDDMGSERWSFSGIDRGLTTARTPRLQALADKGIVFTRAYASPICGPTRSQLMSGRYPHRTGFGTNTQIASPVFALADSEVFLAEACRDARGFSSVAGGMYLRGVFGKWHLCHPTSDNDLHPRTNGFNRGGAQMANAGGNIPEGDYDHFIWRKNTFTNTSQSSTQVGNVADFVAYDTPTGGGNVTYNDDTKWNAYHNAHDYVAWANGQSKPTLGYVCFNPPHEPVQVPPLSMLSGDTITELTTAGLADQGLKLSLDNDPTLNDNARLVTRAMAEAVDTQIGYILDNSAAYAAGKLMVFIIVDNGTPGTLIEAPLTTAKSKRTCYEQTIRVPLIVHGPLVSEPGRQCDHMVQAVDLWRTILDATGGAFTMSGADDGRGMDSISFWPVVRNAAASPARSRVLVQTFVPNGDYVPEDKTRNLWSVRDNRWKYMYRLETGQPAEESFFDLQADEWEDNDLMLGAMTSEQTAAMNALKSYGLGVLADTD